MAPRSKNSESPPKPPPPEPVTALNCIVNAKRGMASAGTALVKALDDIKGDDLRSRARVVLALARESIDQLEQMERIAKGARNG